MFHHTKVVQRDRPKPHLRLHVQRIPMAGVLKPHMEASGREPVALAWKVARLEEPDDIGRTVREQTQWWGTSRLALDAAYYQFACEWPAGRP